MSLSSKRLSYVTEVPTSLFERSLDDKEKRVAVLGSLITWPYIHKICVDIVSGFVAVTNGYIYKPSEDPDSGYYRVKYDNEGKSKEDFVKEKIINRCNSAIIIYPIPGKNAKFAEWCSNANIRTLGLTFVKNIFDDGFCKECILDESESLTYCSYQGKSTYCVPSGDACPFKEQSISSNDLEYFFRSNGKMIMIAIEKLEKTQYIVDDFLNEQLTLPLKLPYVFEFRFDIMEDNYCDLLSRFDQLQKGKEDQFNSVYEYIDYYYKPKDVGVEEWFQKKQSVRIREWKNPLKRPTMVYRSEVQQTSEGFHCKQEFGGQVLFEGKLVLAKKYLEKENMQQFLKTIKMGRYYYLQVGNKIGDIKFKAYLENVDVETLGDDKQKYGYSLEIELWADKPKTVKEIGEKKAEIVNLLGLERCKHQINPMQELTYRWVTKTKE